MAASVELVLRRDKINKRAECPIYIRITKNRKIQYIATGHKLDEKYWDDEKRKVKNSYPNSVRLNNFLNSLKVKYQNEVLKEETLDTTISTKLLKKRITGNNDTDFFVVAREVIKSYEANNKTRTYNKSRSIIQKLKVFLGSDKLPIEEITTTFLSKYEFYLKSTLKNKINTVNKDLRFIRRVFNEAYRRDLVTMDKNPFLKYKLITEKTTKVYLTETEIESLWDLDLLKGSRHDLHRDMFLFSCYTGGLRVSDVLLLQWANYNGTHVTLYIQKTNTPLSIKIPLRGLEVIKKYEEANKSSPFIFPMLNPQIDLKNQAAVNRNISSSTAFINKNLKILAKKAGIEKNISFHCARHTWATLALKKGISIDKVSKLMGHAAIKETQIYAKLVNEELDKAMDAFN